MRVWEDFNAWRQAHRPQARLLRKSWRISLFGVLGVAVLLLVATPARAQVPEVYIKSGPVFQLDDGFFSDTNVGWSIAGGMRQPLRPVYQPSYFFVDIGGSFLSASGEDDPVITPATIQISNAFGGQSFAVPNALSTQLIQLRRGSFDAAIGWTQNPSDGVLHSWIRGGGRVGHIHGVFTDATTPAAQAIINMAMPGDTVTVEADYDKTFTFGGLFFGGGTTVTTTAIDTLAFGPIYVAFGAEGEFAVDWIDFENFGDNELVTASLLFNLTLSR